MTHPILELQAADTMADQLKHRRESLIEREQLQASRNALVRWDQARTVMRKRLDELSAMIEKSESESATIDKKRDKLQKQMRTIIAAREAEALQHEIATLDERRRTIDDEELAALEEQSRIDDDLTALNGQEESLRNTYLSADAALNAVSRDIDGELERIAERLDGLRDAVEKPVLKQYDRLRKQHMIAASSLAGSRCDGCHMDLSPAEVDAVRRDGASGAPAECPQCGRMLVV